MSLFSLPSLRLRAAIACAVLGLLFLGGCASTGNPRDPLEPMNRAVYKFNDGFDKVLTKPAAEMYRDLIPAAIRTGIGNFFSNINDVIVALNNALQGKMIDAINDVGRILVNTTLGVFGVMDVATDLGVEKHNEDFGQTLGRWGFGDGPYIVLPLLGPSSVRDTVGWVGDIYTWPVTYIEPNRDRNAITVFRFVGARSELLEATQILETAALDPYEFVRDAYLQRRRNLVYDGNPPDEIEPEIKDQPRRNGAGAKSPFPAPMEQALSPDQVNADPSVAKKAEAETRAAPPAPAPSAEIAPVASRNRIVRLWLPAGRN